MQLKHPIHLKFKTSSTHKKTARGLLSIVLLATFALLSVTNGYAQNTNDYRSANTGDWNALSTWQRFNGSDWITPTTTQGPPNRTDGAITILSPHIVTVTETVAVDEVIIQTSAEVMVNNGVTWTIYNGVTGDDVTIFGILDIFGTINYDPTVGNSQIGVNGIVINRSNASLNPANVEWTYYNGSTYRHNRNGSFVPKAVSWDPGSTCTIRGVTNQPPTGLDQTFGNFTWNCSGMNEPLDFGVTEMEIKGNFRIRNTGSNLLRYDQNQLSIGGDLIIEAADEEMPPIFRIAGNNNNTATFDVAGGLRITNGILRLGRGAATGILNIAQDVEITSGTLNLANGTATGSLFVAGNFTHTGGSITQVSTGIASINFNGTSLQSFSGAGGTYSGDIDFAIAPDAIVSFGPADLSGSTGSFSNEGTIMGNTTTDEPLVLPGGGLTNEEAGTISPGSSVGTLTITGDLTSNGNLSMEVESLVSFDRIIVTGTATINGTLTPEFGTYAPVDDNTFQLVSATIYNGTLSVNPPMINGTHTISGIWYDANGILEITDVVLPIHLLSFTGQRVDDAIELKWRTATEINNDYMAVERADHEFGFREIGRVAGVGTTTEPQDYHFIDEAPLAGANYYRLRQVDIDGSIEYHPVIYVDYIETSKATTLQVFPNPAQDQIRAAWKAGNDQPATIRLFSASGQLLQTYRINGENGTHELPVDKLTPGVYYLQLNQGAASEQIRFIKQ